MRNRKLTSVLLLTLATFFVVSCSKQVPPLEEPDQFRDVITGVATHISCCSAEIAGKAIVPKNMSTGFTLGISYFTTTEYESIQVEADFFDPEYNYSVNMGSLEPETTYYYRSYLNHLGEIIYGEVKSFKTLAVSSLIQTLDATEINQKEAVLNAFLDLTNCIYDSLEYGFEVTLDGGGTHILKSDNYSGKKFSVKDEFLSIYTKYSVAAYVKLDGHTYKGETKSFTTMPVTATVTAEASEIQYNSATISGCLSVQSEGSFSKSVALYYSSSESTLEGLKSKGTIKTLTLGADGSYSETLSSLYSSTSYNFIVVAKVDDVEFVTEIKSFKTLTIQASVSAEASAIKCNSATISGCLSVQSEGSFSKSVALYYSSSESTLEGLKSKGTIKTLTLGADGSYSETLSSLYSSTSYNFIVVAKVDDVEFISATGNFTTPALPSGFVDLGLSVKWASCNLGASKPTEYGGYYQWAGTSDVSSLDIYLDEGGPYYIFTSGYTKYNTKDNKTVLDSWDDAASVALGGKCRMPTDEEWSELKYNCSWTWTSINGVNGYIVQSKKSGYTDNWIFLPAAGYRDKYYLDDVRSGGYYWSSSLETNYRGYAYTLNFNSGYFHSYSFSGRHEGLSVRPVSE